MNLISIYIVSNILYLPLDYLAHTRLNGVQSLINGTFYHLWFISSLLVGYLTVWYFYYLKQIKLLYILSALILIFALVTDSYDLFLGKNFSFDLARFLLSIPFINIGIWIGKQNKFSKRAALLIALVLIGYFMQFGEAEMFLKLFHYSFFNHQFLVGTFLFSVSLFILAASVDTKKSRLAIWGSKYSLFIYLYHLWAYTIIESLSKKVFPGEHDTIQMFYPIIGFVLILAVAIILNQYFTTLFDFLNGNFTNLLNKKKNQSENQVRIP